MARIAIIPAVPRVAAIGGAVIGAGVSITERRPFGNGPTPTPTPTPTPAPSSSFNTIVMEGDSIRRGQQTPLDGTSSPQPGDATNTYAYRWRATRSDKTIYNRAQGSRSVGTTGNLNDNSNTLMGHVAEDAAFAADLVSVNILANDFTTGTDAQARTNLINWRTALASARPAAKVIWSPPIAYNPTGTPHPDKANFDAQRASLLADCRNPAVWGQWADYYDPTGEIPYFGDPALAAPLFGDFVHPNDAGHVLLLASYKAVMDSLLDADRATSTTMYNAAWIASETNLTASTRIRRRIVVSGLAHTGTDLGASISGGGNPQLRVGGRAWGASVGTGASNGYRLYNGDVLEFELDTSASNDTAVSVDLRIGSETRTLTFRTVAAVTPATYSHSGTASRAAWPDGGTATSHIIPGVTFADTGLGVIALATGVDGSKPTAVTWNGVAATEVIGHPGYYSGAVWVVPVEAGVTANVVATYANARQMSFVSYGTLLNADPTPVSSALHSITVANDPNYPTGSIAVPASGIALGFLIQGGGATAVNGSVGGAGNTLIASGYSNVDNGEKVGIVAARRAANGAIQFTSGNYGAKTALTVVFKAAGT